MSRLILRDSSFKGSFRVTGNSEIYEGKFDDESLFVGRVKIQSSTFGDKMKVASGKFTIDDSTLKSIEMDADQATISGSKLSQFIYRPSREKEGRHKPSLVLDNTFVNGDVIFEKDSGLVVLKGNSKITGKVTNATVVKKNREMN